MHRRGTLVYAVLALAVPLPAFALSDGGGSAGGGLSVNASLDGCGILAAQVVCKIDASWNEVEGTKRYTASVTSPDGSVTDYGEVAGTPTSFWVPFVGNGSYSVTISAWGTDPHGKRHLIAKERTRAPGDKAHAKRGSHPAGAPTDDDPGEPAGAPTGPATPPPSDPTPTTTTTSAPPTTTSAPPTMTTSTTTTTTTTSTATASAATVAGDGG
jgi:hypothetical protein